MRSRLAVLLLAGSLPALGNAGDASAQPVSFFSLDAASPSASTPDEIDAFAASAEDVGLDGFPFLFSVDRASVGEPGSVVASEAAAGQAAGDVFESHAQYGKPANTILYANQAELGLVPALPAGVPAAPPIDDIDSLAGGVLLSLVPGNTLGVSGADIVDAAFEVVVTAAQLGLSPADDIDGLEFSPSGNGPLDISEPVYYFSLARGSPALGSEFSPADVLISAGDGSLALYAPASEFELLPTDNIDALAALPEAGPGLLLASALAALGLGRPRASAR